MQIWPVSLQNGLKMCGFLRGITWATGCNRLKSVRLCFFESMQPQPPVRSKSVRSSSVFSLFLVAWTGLADTNQHQSRNIEQQSRGFFDISRGPKITNFRMGDHTIYSAKNSTFIVMQTGHQIWIRNPSAVM